MKTQRTNQELPGDNMKMEFIWNQFLKLLSESESIQQASSKKVAGIPFVYLIATEGFHQKDLEKAIRNSAAGAMKGKQLHSETVFVRKENLSYIFRHRFYVPQRKMFCCGNLCPDCIRLNNRDY